MRRLLAVLLVVTLAAPAAVAQAEDTAEPRIEWTSPWERGQYEGVPEGDDQGEPDWVADDGTLDLVATIHDDSAIESVTIRRTYEAGIDGDQERDQRTIRLGGVDRIDETIHAGTHGRTWLTVTVRDTAGNSHVARVAVEVEDETAPTAALSATPAGDGMVRVHGTVTDDTQVGEVRLHAVSATKIVSPQQGSVDITENTVEIDTRVPAPPKGVDGAVTVDLVDRAGNTRTITVPVNASTATATPAPTTAATPTDAPTTTSTATPTPTPTATPTPVTLTDLPAETPSPSGDGVTSLFDVLGMLFAGVVVCLGVLVGANVITGGRY